MIWIYFLLVPSFADLDPPASMRGWYASHVNYRTHGECVRVDKKLDKKLKHLACHRSEQGPPPVNCYEDPRWSWFVFPTKKQCEEFR